MARSSDERLPMQIHLRRLQNRGRSDWELLDCLSRSGTNHMKLCEALILW